MGIASLVVSIIAIILSIIPVVGLPISLAALILAIAAICRKKNKGVYSGLKVAGLVISIIAFAISILFTAPVLIGAYFVTEQGEELIDKANDAAMVANEAELKAAVTFAYANAYIENIQPITPSTILKDERVVSALAKANNNTLGIKYEIIVTDNGVEVQKKDKNGNIIVEEDKESAGENTNFDELLVSYILDSIKTYAQAGYILKAVDGDVSAPKLTVNEFENNEGNYKKKLIEMLGNKKIFSDKFTRNNKEAILYNFEVILKQLELGTHMGIGIGCYDSNGNKIYEYGKKEIESYKPTNANIIKYFGYTNERLVNVIAEQIETYAKDGWLLKAVDGDASAPKLTLSEAKNNREQYKTTINESIDDRDIFIAIYLENNKLICKCDIEELLNKLGLSSHMGAGLNVDKNGIQEFILK